MTLWEVFHFEVGYQARRGWTWLYFAIPLVVNCLFTIDAYSSYIKPYHFNSPLLVAIMTLFASVTGMLATSALAGEAAARDVQTQMHLLLYTSPVGKRNYLGGRFLAAFALIALLMLIVEVTHLLSTIVPGAPSDLIGPMRPVVYIGAYVLVALPNAFIATALLFSMAILSRRAIASFIGLALVLVAALVGYQLVLTGRWEVAQILDPLGITVFTEIGNRLAEGQANTFSIVGYAPLLWHR